MQDFARMRRNLVSAVLSAFVTCRRRGHARCLQYDCRSGSGRQRDGQGGDEPAPRRSSKDCDLTVRTCTGQTRPAIPANMTAIGRRGRVAVKMPAPARDRASPARRAARRRWRAAAGEAAEATSILRGQVAACTACTPAACGAAMTPSGVSPCPASMSRGSRQRPWRRAPECCAAGRRCRRRHRAAAIASGVGRAEQTPAATATPPAPAEQIGAPVLPPSRIAGSASASRASISASRSAAIELAGIDRGAQRFGHLVAAVRALHHLAPPLQPDQRERRLRHRLARPRQFVVEGIQRQQRIAPLRRREQRGQEPVGIVPANQRGDRLVHAPEVASSATRASLTRSSTGHS